MKGSAYAHKMVEHSYPVIIYKACFEEKDCLVVLFNQLLKYLFVGGKIESCEQQLLFLLVDDCTAILVC